MTNNISWTDKTWNPIVGCTRCSPGCRGCYAATMAKRQAGMSRAKRAKGQDPGRSVHYEKVENWDGIELVPEALGDPLKWRKPRMVFVCSMSDLFHEDVPFEFAVKIWQVMLKAKNHTFQILTKRPERMQEFLNLLTDNLDVRPIVLPNVWLGVTVCNQDEVWKIGELLRIPAVVHYVSLEPLLGEIDISPYFPQYDNRPTHEYYRMAYPGMTSDPVKVQDGLSLVIVGGETGPRARPMHPAWVRSIRDQCVDADVSFHFKSWGAWCPIGLQLHGNVPGWHIFDDGIVMERIGAKRAGHMLDGVEWREFPQVSPVD